MVNSIGANVYNGLGAGSVLNANEGPTRDLVVAETDRKLRASETQAFMKMTKDILLSGIQQLLGTG